MACSVEGSMPGLTHPQCFCTRWQSYKKNEYCLLKSITNVTTINITAFAIVIVIIVTVLQAAMVARVVS